VVEKFIFASKGFADFHNRYQFPAFVSHLFEEPAHWPGIRIACWHAFP
ncbi:uncharacterized protein METZ01_LOCUS232421, partial [marine metagenome]